VRSQRSSKSAKKASANSSALRYVLLNVKDTGKGAKVKKQSVKSKVVDGGGTDPKFGEGDEGETLLIWCTEDTLWDGLSVDIWDDDVGRDDHMGMFKVDLFQYAALCTVNGDGPDDKVDRMFPVRTKGGKAAGELKAEMDFYPVVELTVTVKEGRNLYNPNLLGKSDPYVAAPSEAAERSGRAKRPSEAREWEGPHVHLLPPAAERQQWDESSGSSGGSSDTLWSFQPTSTTGEPPLPPSSLALAHLFCARLAPTGTSCSSARACATSAASPAARVP
jgi:hypothetical protein